MFAPARRTGRRRLLSLIGSILILSGLLPAVAAGPVLAATPVFINEIHYDNIGDDTGEAVEIAGPAGTNLDGWSLVLYNGAAGVQSVYATLPFSGDIGNLQNGFGTASVAGTGLMNGSPDGIALVNAANVVVQFLSYEGTFTAQDGPAIGLTSTDIGVSEADTQAIGRSIGLTGTGTTYEDFSWTTSLTASFGDPNPGQTFGAVIPNVISLTTMGGIYNQDFNTLGTAASGNTSLPQGWAFSEAGANANTTYSAGTGSNNAGDTYSFGAVSSTDRAFGGLQSGNLIPTIGAALKNDTGDTITKLFVGYVGEQWRLGATSREDRLDFQLSTNATSLTTGTWTDQNDLDFVAPTTGPTVGALNGDAAVNKTVKSFTIVGLTIAPGSTFRIRWSDFNASGADDGLAVDDFSVTPLASDSAPTVASTIPVPNAIDVDVASNVTIEFSEPVNLNGNPFSIECGLSGLHSFSQSGGPTTFVLDPDADFVTSETCTVTVAAAQVTDQDTNDPPDGMEANYAVSFKASLSVTPIHAIQGAAHRSSYEGQVVKTTGIVTARASNGFYVQEPSADASDATSEGIFVFTSGSPATAIVPGAGVTVLGTVAEFRPGAAATNLTTTEITGPTVTVDSSGNPVPAPTVLGIGGRVAPTEVIEDDATGDVEISGVFDPATDGIDFYESLEGMRVQVNDAVVVGPRNDFGELWVLPDDGANAGLRTNRDGIVVRPGDFNPERIQLDDALSPTPSLNVGDHFTEPIIGVLDYNFGNFELLPTATGASVGDGVTRETNAGVSDPDQLSVGAFNVENLDPGDSQAKFDELAELIVDHLQSPDLLSLEEVQDNNGPTNDAVVDANVTVGRLIDAISAAGGPTYQFRQINPVDDQDGGEPGGNIRVAFLFRIDRGLAFTDRPGGGSTTNTTVVDGADGPELSASPGRILSANGATFNASRKPLAGEFTFNGHRLFAIANHFNSKGGDQPLFGRFQPPTLSSEAQRLLQAQTVNDFVDEIVALEPNAEVIVLGDFNDFEFSPPLMTLKGDVLNDLIETLPGPERYSYDFEGNSQTLDHTLVSDALLRGLFDYDVVHVNSEFAAQASDHEPQVVHQTLWQWGGFQHPVENEGTLNLARAGGAIPVKFSLDGNQGTAVFAAGFPKSLQVDCDTTEPTDPIEETAAPGQSGLQYDPVTDTYTYVWKTNKNWANSCRQLILQLADGSVHVAEFQFTK